MSSGFGITEFQAVVAVVLALTTLFVGWNARHERWFRDRLLPLYRDYYGSDDDGTNPGHKENIHGKVERVEDLSREAKEQAEGTRTEIQELRGDVHELSQTVEEANAQDRRLLRRIVFSLDEKDVVDIREVAEEDDFFRGSKGD